MHVLVVCMYTACELKGLVAKAINLIVDCRLSTFAAVLYVQTLSVTTVDTSYVLRCF